MLVNISIPIPVKNGACGCVDSLDIVLDNDGVHMRVTLLGNGTFE